MAAIRQPACSAQLRCNGARFSYFDQAHLIQDDRLLNDRLLGGVDKVTHP
jgi:hypothetical protein